MTRRYVIVGNGIAGQTCAEELRLLDPDGAVTMIAGEPHPLYNRVALPRFLKGQLRWEKVMLRSVEDYAERGIDIRFSTHADRIDPDRRTVMTHAGEEIGFDSLLLATGGRPRSLDAPGMETVTNAHAFYTLDDARRIAEAAEQAKRVLVIGGSFIAYELAEAIAHRGPSVTWLMRGPWFLRTVLDEDGGRVCRALGERAGVDFACSDTIVRFEGNRCITGSGRAIDFDMLVYGIGLDFNTQLARDAGLGVDRGILTDAKLQTDQAGIYAAGDVAQFDDVVLGRRNQVGTWDNAQAQGRVAAMNMAGGAQDFIDVATYTTTMFGSTLAVMGLTPEHGLDLEAFAEFELERGHYRKLFFREAQLVGAVMIGSPKGRKKLIEMIRAGEAVAGPRGELLTALPQ